MNTVELRDLDSARMYVVQGLWLQRLLPPAAATVRPALEWALEVASAGQPLPPVGFVADLGHAAFQLDEVRTDRREQPIPGFPSALARTYEDYVLGKLYADWTFARAADALRSYQGRDRARGLAFLLNQFRERAGFGGVELSPAVLKGLLQNPPEDVLRQGWEALTQDGVQPLLIERYHDLIAAARRTAEVLAPEDLFELEHGTALDDLGQRLALRQVLQAATQLEASLPALRPPPRARRQQVPTRVLDEDTYPVGGYSSLSTRGSLESLLHSQLAYMDHTERPDLFDIKYLRDELLYYARDENQFWRQRRAFVIILFPDLVQARFKDAAQPWQRIVLLLGLLVAAVRRLSEWLSTDALRFVFLFVAQDGKQPLNAERRLLETVLREPIAHGIAELALVATATEASQECTRRARRSLCHGLAVSTGEVRLEAEGTVMTRLQFDSPCPALNDGAQVTTWSATLGELLQRWV
jgi:hypothetical protein